MFYKSFIFIELLMGIEPATSSLPRKCSTPELQQRFGVEQRKNLSVTPVRHFIPTDLSLTQRAEDGAQTRDPQLGRLMLYRLSYFRKIIHLVFPQSIEHLSVYLLATELLPQNNLLFNNVLFTISIVHCKLSDSK